MGYNFIRSLIGIITDKYNKQQQQLAYCNYLTEKKALDNLLRQLLSEILNTVPAPTEDFSIA